MLVADQYWQELFYWLDYPNELDEWNKLCRDVGGEG